VFVERKITGRLHNEATRHFSGTRVFSQRTFFDVITAICGWQSLIDAVETFGCCHDFTALIPKFDDVDPDDAFSRVPYEKGSTFLFHLETEVCGVPSVFLLVL
jgi:leukotriene-A4 hydrolase